MVQPGALLLWTADRAYGLGIGLKHQSNMAHRLSVAAWNRAMERHAQVRANFLRVEVETGIVFAEIALTASDAAKRARNTKNAKTAYSTILRFMAGFAKPDLQAISSLVETLNRMLVALGEMSPDVLGRRLDDRIRKLSAIAESFPHDSPARQRITDRIKAEISEYFEREKNPAYRVDRRSPTAPIEIS